MATKNKAVRKAPAKNGPAAAPEVVELPMFAAIEVSFAGDGKPRVDIDPAMIVAGGEVIWHTPPGERRAFKITLEPGAKLTRANRAAAAKAARGGTKSASLSEARVLRSSLRQVVSVRVPPKAEARMWDCIIDADGVRVTTGVLILGTNVIVRPPKPKVDEHGGDGLTG
ncbi:MAG: hypothetical protein ABI843_00890 [Dokdonella sp.]